MNKKYRIIMQLVFSVFASGMIFFTETANSTMTTIESDTFIRCLIGECMDTDGNPVDNPFQDVIRGTDLGIFARDPYDAGFTYIFLGDTDNPGVSDGRRDAYLKIPNNELRHRAPRSKGCCRARLAVRPVNGEGGGTGRQAQLAPRCRPTHPA